MNKKIYSPLLVFLFCLCLLNEAVAQFTVSGQVRTRTEMRNGQGTLQVKDTVPAVFTSQRTRINLGYGGYRRCHSGNEGRAHNRHPAHHSDAEGRSEGGVHGVRA